MSLLYICTSLIYFCQRRTSGFRKTWRIFVQQCFKVTKAPRNLHLDSKNFSKFFGEFLQLLNYLQSYFNNCRSDLKLLWSQFKNYFTWTLYKSYHCDSDHITRFDPPGRCRNHSVKSSPEKTEPFYRDVAYIRHEVNGQSTTGWN